MTAIDGGSAMTGTTVAKLGCILSLLAGCGAAEAPRAENRAPAAQGRLVAQLPDWITEPATLPAGLVGQNNCPFPFGQIVPQWNFHPEAGCWEHAGPDGWTRQQFQRIHIPKA